MSGGTPAKREILFCLVIIMSSKKIKLSFSKDGLNLIRMGEKLDTSITNYLYDIDTCNIEGELEYRRISSIEKTLNYKKLNIKIFDTNDLDSVKNIYIGFSADNLVKKMVLDYSNADRKRIYEMVINLYGNPQTQLSSGFEGFEFPNSYMWTKFNFRIDLFHGDQLSFYYRDP